MESLQPRLIAKHKETFLSQLTGSSSRNSAGAESLLGALARSRVQEEPTEQSGWRWCPWVWRGLGRALCSLSVATFPAGRMSPRTLPGLSWDHLRGLPQPPLLSHPLIHEYLRRWPLLCARPGWGEGEREAERSGCACSRGSSPWRREEARTQPTTGGGRGRGVGGLGGRSGRGRLRPGAPRV